MNTDQAVWLIVAVTVAVFVIMFYIFNRKDQ